MACSPRSDAGLPGAISGLPPVFYRVVPELLGLAVPHETRAPCDVCPLAVPAEGHVCFSTPARCCTYQPSIPGFLVGRALEREGRGAARLRRRIRDGDGVSAGGLHPGEAWSGRLDRAGHEGFGTDPDLSCPLWEDGRCTVYDDRGAMCRTFSCRHVDHERGRAVAVALGDLLDAVERALQRVLIGRGCAPPDGVDPDYFEDWYRWCAEAVESVDAETVRGLPVVSAALSSLQEALDAREAPIPDRLVARVAHRAPGAVSARSPFDLVSLPSEVLALLDRLDGRPWPEALADGPLVDEVWVARLVRWGLAEAPER